MRTFTEEIAAPAVVGVGGVHALEGWTAPAGAVAAAGSVAGHCTVEWCVKIKDRIWFSLGFSS